MTQCRKTCISLLALSIGFVSTHSSASASSSGIVRRSTPISGGCGPAGCHAATANTLTTVSISEAVDSKITVAKGQKIRLTMTVSNQTRSAVGCDISVKTSLNGSSNAGTLTAVADEGLRVSIGELTHNFPKPLVNQKVSFAFDWTAPNTEGTYFLHAAVNAVNLNGSSDPNDIWNFLTPVQLIVSGTNGVDDFATTRKASISPQPAHESVRISAKVDSDEDFVLNIFNTSGDLLAVENVSARSNSIEYDWLCRDLHGNRLPSGSYPFNIVGTKAVFRGSILLTR